MLDDGNSAMSEVVVVGYGTKLRRKFTSSISKITNKDFQNLPLNSFESTLQGHISSTREVATGAGTQDPCSVLFFPYSPASSLCRD
jgi:hypothetical protein